MADANGGSLAAGRTTGTLRPGAAAVVICAGRNRGALGLPARSFTLWQVVGGVVWAVGLVLAGFLLGRSIPGVDQYLLPIIALIVVVSLIPLAVEALRAHRHRGPSA